MSMHVKKQVSHPRHARPLPGQKKREKPTNDRGWGGAGAVGWGVLGAFGSMEKDTRAQVVRKAGDPSIKMIKNDKGLWVKVRADLASGAAGRGEGIPVMYDDEYTSRYGLQGEEAEQNSEDDASDWRRRSDSRESRRRSASSDYRRESSSDRDDRRRGTRRRPSSSSSESSEPHVRHRHERDSLKSRSRSRDRRRRIRSRSLTRSRDHNGHRTDRSSDRRGRHVSRSEDEGRRGGARTGRAARQRSRNSGDDGVNRHKSERLKDDSSSRKRDRQEQEDEKDRNTERTNTDENRVISRPRAESLLSASQGSPPSSPPPPDPTQMCFTAAQLADRLVEVYNVTSPKRIDNILACFHPETSLVNLKSGAVAINGHEKLARSMPANYAKRQAECTRRLYMASDNAADPSFCLDYYPAGHGPGFNAIMKGVEVDTMLLYQAGTGPQNQIVQVWIAPDTKCFASRDAEVKELDLLSSKAFPQVMAVIKGKINGKLAYYFHDYRCHIQRIG